MSRWPALRQGVCPEEIVAGKGGVASVYATAASATASGLLSLSRNG
jgi:hypothetical protein